MEASEGANVHQENLNIYSSDETTDTHNAGDELGTTKDAVIHQKDDELGTTEGIVIRPRDPGPILLGSEKIGTETQVVDMRELLKRLKFTAPLSSDAESQFGQQLKQLVSAIKEKGIPDASFELPGVAEKSQEKVSEIGEKASHGTWLPVDPRELELFTRGAMLGASQISGTEKIRRVVDEVLKDPLFQETLRQVVEKVTELDEVTEQVTNKIASADDPNKNMIRWLVLGCAILIAVGAGAIVPLIAAPATAEVILTNEVAIFAVAIAAAALIRGN